MVMSLDTLVMVEEQENMEPSHNATLPSPLVDSWRHPSLGPKTFFGFSHPLFYFPVFLISLFIALIARVLGLGLGYMYV